MERTLSIGQLASATGLAPKTIRYYEAMGVLPAPRRSAAGYRQYVRSDVHRALFIRRARALGFPLDRLRALTVELDGRPSRTLRPRLQQLVMEHLRALRDQIADLRVLEQQLEQVLQRLRALPSTKGAKACACLDGVAASTAAEARSLTLTRKQGGASMDRDSTMEGITRLSGNGDCDCGCSCAESDAVSPLREELPRLSLGVTAGKKGRTATVAPSRATD